MTSDGQAGLVRLLPLGQIPQVLSRKGLLPESKEARKGVCENLTSKRYVTVIATEVGRAVESVHKSSDSDSSIFRTSNSDSSIFKTLTVTPS
jgi:hypothetical protein